MTIARIKDAGIFAACITLASILSACGTTNSVTPQTVPPATPSSTTSTHFKLLHSFAGGSDGADPLGRLIIDAAGALYGTTAAGGSDVICVPQNAVGCGTVFKLTPSGSGYSESVIYRFGGYAQDDGAYPAAGLVADASGSLYGTTEYGNIIGYGILFKLTPTASGYSESILHNFSDSPDGTHPAADLVLTNGTTLFGTTTGGGWQYGCYHFCQGCGAIFTSSTSGSGYDPLYSFCKDSNGTNGSSPHAGLVYGKGAFYGVTSSGGTNGTGTIFRFQGTLSVLHDFCEGVGCKGGMNPEGALIQDGKGALYGTTENGGRGHHGLVFKLVKTRAGYKEHVLYHFRGIPDGANPLAALVADKAGSLYGTTSGGGSPSCNCGTVFKLTPSSSGYRESVLYSFTGNADGAAPRTSLAIDANGNLFGTASAGGSTGNGTVFEVTP